MPKFLKLKNKHYGFTGFEDALRPKAKAHQKSLKAQGKKAVVRRNGNKWAVFSEDLF